MELLKKSLWSLAMILFCTSSFAQTKISAGSNEKKWGFEAELVQPFISTVGIFQFQLSRTLSTSQKGLKRDLVLGAYLRPNVKHDVVKEIDEYWILLAYRHYLWKGLHAEGGMNSGYYWGTENLIDGKDYEGFALFWEASIGYKLDFGKNDQFYFNPQIGVLSNIIADIGPRGGKTDTFFQPQIFVGINF